MKKFMFSIIFFIVIMFSAAVPSAVHAAEIDHDKVVGFREVNPTTVTQKAAKKFQPYLKVWHGCVPFPAVDAAGNTSRGLKTSGSHNGGCSSNIGQVYSRSDWYNGSWAIMYAWYFPKDNPSPGLGHRHDWESIVVWIDNPAVANPLVQSIAYSGHGQYKKAAPSAASILGTNPLVGYDSNWPLNHELDVSGNVSGKGMQPLIGWDDLTPAARHALNTTDFGSANVPFKDSNFKNNLAKAWYR